MTASLTPSRQLDVISRIALALNGSIALTEALDTALGLTAELLGLETGWIWLEADDGSGFYLAASRSLPPGFVGNPSWVKGSCTCQSLFRSGQLEQARNIDVISCSRLHEIQERARPGDTPTGGFSYHASVPLLAHGRQIGIVNLGSRDWRELSTDELAVLRTISDLLAIAVERTRLFRRAQELGAAIERQRVARELHAEVGASLHETKRSLDRLNRAVITGRAPDKLAKPVHDALARTEAAIESTRRSLTDLGGLGREGVGRPTLPEAVALLDQADAPRPELTPREWEVLPLLARGLSNREVAGELSVSERTAKFHVSSLLRKFDALNRTEVVARALRLGMLGADEG